MRIAIIATGSRGDVEPYIALGKGLIAVGNEVILVTHGNFKVFVQSHGVEFWPVGGNVQDVAQSDVMRELLEKGNFLAIMSQMAKAAQEGAVTLAKGGLAACHDVDLILGGMGGVFPGISLAAKFSLPFMQAYLVPFTPTQSFASVLLPGQASVPTQTLRRFSHHLTRQVMWQSFRKADRIARREVLEIPDAPFWGPYNSERTLGNPILYGFSPLVIPPPPDWGGDVHITGYWFLDPKTDWRPPSALMEFLEAGPPPVYVGFGSMSNRKPEETADLIVEALERSRQRGIMLSGWSGLRKADIPDSVFMIDSIPHSWLFPRLAAVVHHGGVGTTAAGLRAGVPSVVIPFFGDQPFWGNRIAQLGVGPSPIPRKELTAQKLATALNVAVSDLSMQQRASNLGSEIRSEDGTARAVAVINDFGIKSAS
ncbi:MAG: glycosyltransferase [Anaerolineales bacterium]|jgi:sterol 3beta-glucosyltransferase|nr:glycosyltransferase [Anaerolineales bacterium]